LSRAGADAVFDKLMLGLWAASAIEPWGLVASLDLRGQTGFGDPLLRSEQFSVATVAMISGLPSGAVVGDNAVAGRLQLGRPIGSGSTRIVPYVFGAKARVELEQPTVLEAPSVRLDAYGVGIRGEYAFSSGLAVAFGAEWSRTDATQPEYEDDGFAFRVTFRL
jgi:hemolysin activation/secretion protein